MKKERKQVDITLLKTPEHNTRIHPEKQIKEIRRSLKKWGQYRDIVIDDQFLILAGNGLVEAMRAENFKKAWAVIMLTSDFCKKISKLIKKGLTIKYNCCILYIGGWLWNQ